jgi:hypothetical protein
MEKTVNRFYWTALLLLLILSAYPVAMGVKIAVLQFQGGSIQPDDFAQYVIPYAAAFSSILLTVFLYPLISRQKRFSVLTASLLSMGLFIGMEWYIESMTINTSKAQAAFQWQLVSSIGTTETTQAFQKLFDSTFRIQSALISFLLILFIVGMIYNYKNVLSSNDRVKRNLFRLQVFLTVLFIAFCITANIPSSFREAVDFLSPHSSVLTSCFFVLMGVTFGVYLAGFLSGKSRMISLVLPAACAFLITASMYYGEYKMLDGVLYRFGYSKFFQQLSFTRVTPVDMLITFVSGMLTAFLAGIIRWTSRKQRRRVQETE